MCGIDPHNNEPTAQIRKVYVDVLWCEHYEIHSVVVSSNLTFEVLGQYSVARVHIRTL